MKVRTAAAYTVAIVLFCMSPLLANPFTEVVVFGDSHSDTGNWGSRFSNGPVWVEELASQLGAAPPAPSRLGSTNYAWGGAETGWGYDILFNKSVPKLGTQVEEFLSGHTLNPGQIFVLFAGHNDFARVGETDPAVPAGNLAQHISTLAQAGGINFVVSNLLPLGQIPAFRGTSDELVLDNLAIQFNSLLSTELDNLEASLNVDVCRVEFHGLLEAITNDPLSFGMTNVLDPANATAGANASEFLYWDSNHFTTVTHELLGQLAFRSVISGKAWTSSRQAAAIYTVIDNDSESQLDDVGDTISNRLSQPRGSVGENDGESSNSVSRLVSKFQLPSVPDATRLLGDATLRFFLEDKVGVPEGSVSVWHSVADNGQPHRSDYEDDSYKDMLPDLVQPTDPIESYYELDVTELVRADYAADGLNPMSAFRLQIDELVFVDDGEGGRYRFTMPGAETNHPELVLTFIPEPSTITLGGLGMLCLVVYGWGWWAHRIQETGEHL